MEHEDKRKIISAEEIANYVVCAEAWRLKYLEKGKGQPAQRKDTGHALRKEWIETQELSAKLRSYAKTAYLLLVLLVIIVFLMEHQRTSQFFHKKSPSSPEMPTAQDGGQ
jgi:hypothetical protein